MGTRVVLIAFVLSFLAVLPVLKSEEIGTADKKMEANDGSTAETQKSETMESFVSLLLKENERHRAVLTDLREKLKAMAEMVVAAKNAAEKAAISETTPPDTSARPQMPDKSAIRELAGRFVDEGILYRVNLAHLLKVHRNAIVDAVAENLADGKIPGYLLMESMSITEVYGGKKPDDPDALFTADLTTLESDRGRLPQRGVRLFDNGSIPNGEGEHEEID